ncbi:MAG TPA: hypothetical protein VFE47_19470 [Tepidisphaeraceae bacterium]|jgi:hypothetical protein|nr:hypothetical protein [Tepidisphaeraceae bacterium]
MMGALFSTSRIRRLTVLAICAAPVVLAFQRAGQQSAPPPPPATQVDVSDFELAQVGIFDRPRDKADAERQRAMHPGRVSEEEWAAAKAFLEVHSRNRVRLIDEKISGEPREGLKRFLVNKWHSIMQLQSQSPELYKTKVREVELDDLIFGDCLDLKQGQGNAKEIQAKLNARITELFNLGLTERKQRMKLVENSLVEQKKSLENDEHDKARLIQQQYELVLAHGVEGARLDNHRPGKSKPSASTTPSSPGEEK